ncbi:MAG: hypothetical protein HY644_03385 [Acidobacteria bacterium]|nr:hypothetical protein [Acidobacteriota bacterium]
MDRQQAIKTFVESHLKILTSPDFSRQLFRKLERDVFYGKYQNKYGRPTLKDVLLALVQYLRSRGVAPERIRQYMDDLPIFREIGNVALSQLHSLVDETCLAEGLEEKDIETIKTVGAYEAVKKSKSAEIEREAQKALDDLHREIEQRRTEYENLPSVLDYEAVVEPDFDPQVEVVNHWWEHFYLTADPFPRKDGLSDISEDLYELVLVKTKPFRETLSALEHNENCLFHTGFLLAGDYGYGKTTFIDYISYYLIHRSILLEQPGR